MADGLWSKKARESVAGSRESPFQKEMTAISIFSSAWES